MSTSSARSTIRREPGLLPGAPLQLSYELSRTDLLQFWRYFVRFHPQLQRLLLVGYPVALLLVTLLAQAQSLGPGGFNPLTWSMGLAAAAIGLGAGYPLLIGLYPGMLARRSAGAPGFLGGHTLEVSAEGLVHRTSVSEGRYSWRTVQRVVRTGPAIYIFFDRQIPIIIPRRAIPPEERPGIFFELLDDYREQSRQTLRPPDEMDAVDVLEAAPIPEDAVVTEFELHGSDLRRFVRYHVFHRERGTTGLAILGMACVGGWGLNGGLWGAALSAVAGVLVFGVLIPNVMLGYLSQSPGVMGHRLLVFSGDGIIGRAEALGEGLLAWGGVDAIVNTHDDLLFYYGPATAVVVPKRSFAKAGDGAADRFRARCEEWWRKSRRSP